MANMEHLVSAVARVRNTHRKATSGAHRTEHGLNHQPLQQERSKSPRKRPSNGSEPTRKRKRNLHSIVATPASSEDNDGVRYSRPEGSYANDNEDYDSTIDIDVTEDRAQKSSTPEIFSTFVPSKDNVLVNTTKEWRIRLNDGDSLALVGQYGFWIIEGSITLLGGTIHRSSRLHKVHAPTTYSIPIISHFRDPSGPDKQPTVIQFENLWTGIREISYVSPFFEKLWDGNGTPLIGRSFNFIAKQEDDEQRQWLRPLDIPQKWQAFVQGCLGTNSPGAKVIMITGRKNVGKSTLSQLLVNRAITSSEDGVALLDSDPGQPEYSPPGNVSLVHLRTFNFGAPFTHPLVPRDSADNLIRAHYIGSTSPKHDPRLYVQCAIDLFSHYQRLLGTYPLCSLVINCCGWAEDRGLTLLLDFVKLIKPTDLVYMHKSQHGDATSVLHQAADLAGSAFHSISAQSGTAGSGRASNLRETLAQSYFHVDKFHFPQLQWNCMSIHSMEPFPLKYAGPAADIYGFMAMGSEFPVKYLPDLMNGSIVGAVVMDYDSVEPENALLTYNDLESEGFNSGSYVVQATASQLATQRKSVLRRSEEGFPYLFASYRRMNTPLDPSKTHCIGQILIRGIDVKAQTIQVITPIPTEDFQKYKGKILLVRGSLDIPAWAFEEEIHAGRAFNKNMALWRTHRISDLVQDPDNYVTDTDFDEDAWYKSQSYLNAPYWIEKGTSRSKAHEFDRDPDE